MKEQCPKCGNWVEGKKVATFARKMTRGAVKKGSAVATGMAIGSIIPGAGTIIGGALGLAASALMDDSVNEVADLVEDIAFDETEYEFRCPKCGCTWKRSNVRTLNCNNSNLSYSNNGTEQDLFIRELNYYLENSDRIIDTKENVQSYIKTINDKVTSYNSIIESEYFFLKAICCLDYSFLHEDDKTLISLGNYNINNAISAFPKNGEYILVKLMFDSFSVNHNASVVVKIQSNIQYKYFEITMLDNNMLDNTLLNTEYLTELYEKARFYSLVDSVCALENRENYNGAVECLEMMIQLSDIGYKLCGYELLMDYYYFGRKGLIVSKENGFNYAQKGYELADFSNEFNPEIGYHSRWLRCLERIAYAYLEGEGTNQDYPKAFELTTKAANLGGMYSAYNLGEIYELGRGVSVNKALALEWYEKAFELGLEGAKEKIDQLRGITSTSTQKQTSNSSISEDEQEYLEEVKMCLEEDNEISPRERRLLDRLRNKLNISEERAKELEESLKAPQLTEDEQEYLEEYKLCMEEDGEISSKERRLLDRLRDKLGISVERAKELENYYN